MHRLVVNSSHAITSSTSCSQRMRYPTLEREHAPNLPRRNFLQQNESNDVTLHCRQAIEKKPPLRWPVAVTCCSISGIAMLIPRSLHKLSLGHYREGGSMN
ncbi:hypothetical protein T1E_4288 [Pseudomonas putida DOT-T1E]|uniref:Uncharacterized protein n=1 Tax=Pseudomonas putida (strain DOT-T1E) TaxID=1196325 RepID=I7C136_PSEPT|nr:hypothetical protein T1E_4288 [Pseudomonas putida DOT-T1E]